MFEHLIDPDCITIDDAEPADIIGAQMRTMDFLADDDGMPPAQPRDRDLARAAFTATLSATSKELTKEAVLSLKTPAAVQHHVAMLTQYDWDFVEQAKELRGFVVSKLLDMTAHPDARIKLRSLELIGKLAEVGSFMERSEVTHKTEGASEIEERLRAKLKSLLPPVQEIETIETVAEKQHDNTD